MSDDNEQQLRQDPKICECCRLQLDGLSGVSVSQLLVFIKMVFIDGSIKEVLKTILFHGKTRGDDIFQSFNDSFLEINDAVHELVLLTTDGTPAMTRENLELIWLCKNYPTFPNYCVIHQQHLCTKVINFQNVISVVQKL
jgi:hypothetical protein